MGLQTMSILAIADTHTHNTSSSIGSPVKILDILIELVCVFECESKTYLATCASSNSKKDGVVLVVAVVVRTFWTFAGSDNRGKERKVLIFHGDPSAPLERKGGGERNS